MSRSKKPPRPRVALLGAGYIADWHLRALRTLPVEIVAIVDADASRAANLAQRYRIAQSFTTIDALVSEAKPDVVHVLLPPNLHAEFAQRLLELGVHVLLEKPACVSVEECDRLLGTMAQTGKQVGVSHNFLFAPVYEQLRADVRDGRLGPLQEIDIIWAKELGQLRGGPFGGWLFREPLNTLLEVGPHSMGQALDLVGELGTLEIVGERPIELPGDQSTYQRWLIRGEHGSTKVEMRIALESGFTEHRIHVRGKLAAATVDFEAGTYVLQQHAPLPDDFDRQQMSARAGHRLVSQSRSKLLRYGLSKFKLSSRGSDYGTSIRQGLAQFYEGLNGTLDPRLSLALARQGIVALTSGYRGVPIVRIPATPREATPSAVTGKEVVVLGGTGFIGQALVQQLVALGHRVRLVVRDPRYLPLGLRGLPLDVRRGDLGQPAQLDEAFAGADVVCHLARAHVKTWADYERLEIGGTRNVLEAAQRQQVGRLLYTGTIDSYYAGDANQSIQDMTPVDAKIHRRNLYARAKAMSEQLLREQAGSLPVTIFRPGIVIGRGGSPFHWGVGMWFAQAVVRLWGRGDHPMPFVLVDDTAWALAAAVTAENIAGKTYNLVGEPLLSARDYLAEVERAGGLQLDQRPTPVWRFYGFDLLKYCIKVLVRHPERQWPSYRDWQSRTQRSPIYSEGAKNDLGWCPETELATMIENGIRVPVREWLA